MTKQSAPSGKITQGSNADVIVDLRPNISISHSYKKKNRIELTFKDDQKKYIVERDSDLEEIYKLHMTHPNVEVILRKYCKEHLNEV